MRTAAPGRLREPQRVSGCVRLRAADSSACGRVEQTARSLGVGRGAAAGARLPLPALCALACGCRRRGLKGGVRRARGDPCPGLDDSLVPVLAVGLRRDILDHSCNSPRFIYYWDSLA